MGDIAEAQLHGHPPTLPTVLANPSKILFQQEIPVETSQAPETNPKTPAGQAPASSPQEASQEEQEESALKKQNALKKQKTETVCGVCGEQSAKYRCPGCGTQTCSLECSKGHKLRTGCKGQRNKTAMVQMAEFDEKNLISDYNFLEETLRQNEAARRVRGTFEGGPYSRTPPKLMALINQARNRRIELILLSSDLSRRKANTSYYDRKRKCFYWRIEWIFPSADVQLATPKLDEHKAPVSALSQLLEARPGNAVLRHKLRDYCDVGPEKLTYLLRKDCCKASEQVYYKLDPSRPLRKLLQRKSLIEFPVITVALPSEVGKYAIEEEEPEESSESAWGASSGKGGQSSGSVAALVDPRLYLYAEEKGAQKGAGGDTEVGLAALLQQEDGNGPPEELPIIRGSVVGGNVAEKLEAGEDEDVPSVELAALLGEAAMADFVRKRNKEELEPGEIVEEQPQ